MLNAYRNQINSRSIFKLINVSMLKLIPIVGMFLVNIYIAKIVGLNLYGEYSVAIGIQLFFGPVLAFGVPEIILRKASTYSFRNQSRESSRLLARGLMIVAIGSLLYSTVLAIFWASGLIKNHYFPVIFCAPAISVCLVAAAYLRGWGSVQLSQFMEGSFRIFAIILLLPLSVAFTDSDFINIAYPLALVCALGLAAYQFATPLKGSLSRQKILAFKRTILNGLPFVSINLLQGIKNFGDLFLVGFFLGTNDSGIYLIGMQFALLVAFPQMVLTIIFSRRMSWYIKQNELLKLTRDTRMVTLVSVTFGSFCFLGLLAFGSRLIPAYLGQDYEGVYMVALLLVVGRLAHVAMGPNMQVLALANQQSYAARITVWVTISNMVLSAILISLLGIMGAAISNSLSLTAWAALLKLSVARRVLKVNR